MSETTPAASATFESFGLDVRITEVLAESGFVLPTDIQSEAIPPLLEGRDVVGRSRTGSGKTAAFALPALERIKDGVKGPRVLVLAPTRELAMQVSEAVRGFAKKLPIRVACIYGGASYTPQLKDLRSGAQFIVATPGRLMDHMKRGSIDLSAIETLVLDEADEMLRMGFIEDVEEILSATPSERQVCLFSATMPPAIRRVAQAHLSEAVEVQVELEGLSTHHIEQRWMMVPIRERLETLARFLESEDRGTTLVFARTRRDCAELADALARCGVAADALHGALNQPARERVLQRMRSRQVDVVVATDVAARGIDVEHITHVINVHLPTDVETYVHRIGRTGRAGRRGIAVSFATRGEARRINAYERALQASIVLHQVPTKRDVAIRKRATLKQELERARSSDLSHVGVWLDELRASGWSDEDLASSAMQLLSEAIGIELGPLPPEEERTPYTPPKPGRERRAPKGRDGGPSPNFEALNEVQIILFTGSNFGVRPGDLVGAIANELDVSGSSIGKVNVLERKSFVGLPREIADKVVSAGQTLVVRGRPVRVDIAHSLHDGPPERRRPRGGDRDRPAKKRGDASYPAPYEKKRPAKKRGDASYPAPYEKKRPAKGGAAKRQSGAGPHSPYASQGDDLDRRPGAKAERSARPSRGGDGAAPPKRRARAQDEPKKKGRAKTKAKSRAKNKKAKGKPKAKR